MPHFTDFKNCRSLLKKLLKLDEPRAYCLYHPTNKIVETINYYCYY